MKIVHIMQAKGRAMCGKLTSHVRYSLNETNCKPCFEQFKNSKPEAFKLWKERVAQDEGQQSN